MQWETLRQRFLEVVGSTPSGRNVNLIENIGRVPGGHSTE